MKKNQHPENCPCEVCHRWHKMKEAVEAKAVKFPSNPAVAWTTPVVTPGNTYVFVRQWPNPAQSFNPLEGATWSIMIYRPVEVGAPSSKTYSANYMRISRRDPDDGSGFVEFWPFAGLVEEIARLLVDPQAGFTSGH